MPSGVAVLGSGFGARGLCLARQVFELGVAGLGGEVRVDGSAFRVCLGWQGCGTPLYLATAAYFHFDPAL